VNRHEQKQWLNWLLVKLPPFDPAWSEPVKAGWWRCYKRFDDMFAALDRQSRMLDHNPEGIIKDGLLP